MRGMRGGIRLGEAEVSLALATVVAAFGLLLSCTTRDVTSVVVGAVEVNPNSADLLVDDTVHFTAVVRADDGRVLSTAAVTWSSKDPTVVSVGSNGIARGMGAGSADVQASFRGVSGAATVNVAPRPAIAVDPDSISFSGSVGGTVAAQGVQVTNGGGGTLDGLLAAVQYGAGQPTGWLDAALAHSSAPADLTLTPTTASLPEGTYDATVSITAQTASNSPVSVPVTLTLVEDRPIIHLSQDSVTLRAEATDSPATTTVQVTNVGGADLTGLGASIWYATAGGSWLSATLSGDTAPATVTITVDPAGLDPGTHRGEVRVTSPVAVASPVPVTVAFIVGPAANVAVTKAGPAAAMVGDEITYTIEASNAGPQTAASVVVTDVIPSGTSVVSASAGTVSDGTLRWPLDSLALGQTASMNLVLRLESGSAGTLTNLVWIASSLPDPDLNDNTAAARTAVGVPVIADLSVTKSGPATAVQGDRITYTVGVSNAGPDTAQGVSVVDTLPAGVTFVSASAGTESSGVVTWDVGALAAAGTQSTSIVVDVDTTTAGSITNRAWVHGASVDSVAANDSSSVSTVVSPPAGITIAESDGSTVVAEGGTTDDFTVVLDVQPATDVVLTVTSGDVGEATVSPATLTFTNANWSTPQSVTVTGVDDALIDGNQVTAITVAVDSAASDAAYGAVADRTVNATTTDDDAPAFTITQTGGSTVVSESGTADTFTVILNAQPATDVVFTITSGDTGEAAAVPATLTFTNANWNVAQTVTVTGVDDQVEDGDQVTAITVSVDDANSDNAYDPLPDQAVSVTTTDNDAAGFRITDVDPLVVTEAGSTYRFTVVLTAQPTSDVVLTVTSGDTTEATVSPARLTFTTANWNVAQTDTVTGVDDAIVDGSQVTTLTVSVDDASSDDRFDPLADQTRSVTTTDNDAAGFILTGGPLTVDETGTTGTFTVRLTAQPLTNVVFTVSSSDTGEATAAPATLTFTNANWDVAQTVTVTGVDDAFVDGPQASTITVSVDPASSDDVFDAVADQAVAVTTTDNEAAGFTVTGGPLTVSEAGTTGTFTVVLTTQPTSNVVFGVAGSDPGEASAAPATLTFTPASWNVAQTVTVTGVDDAFVDGDQASTVTVSVIDASSDNAFGPLPDQTVAVTTTDDDGAGFTITGGPLTVSESGTTGTFTVVLTAQPATNVVFTVASSDAGEATAAPATLTFTSANWNTPQTVTVTGVDDALIDGDQASTVTVSVDDANSDNVFDPLADQTVAVTTADDDAAGFTIAGGPLTVSESGTFGTFTVALAAQPASNVVLTVTSSDTGEATAAPATLTFTSANWNVAQTVTVTGVDDALVDGNQTSTVTVSVDDASSDDRFDPLADQAVDVTTTDNDAPGLTVTQSGGSTAVSETGSTDSFTVVLTAQPSTNVVVAVTSGDVGEATVSPATLTFTNANWNVAQTVTVTGVDDAAVDGSQVTPITIAVDDANSDNAYDAVPDQTVNVTTSDNDFPGFNITDLDPLVVTEAGSTYRFTVALNAQPLTDVVLDVASSDVGEAAAAPAALTFTDANWNTPQTVTVTGVDDALVDGSQVSIITVSVNDAASDDAFDPVANQTRSVTTTDDDAAGFTITGGPLTVDESGTTDSFTVVLAAQPTSNVVLTLASSDVGEAAVAPATLTFTNANWNVAQTVTVTGVDDAAVDGNQASTITVAVDDANSDDVFDPVANQTVAVTTTDDDVAGFSVTGNPLSVSEAGTTATFTTVLTSQPLTNVVLNVTSSDPGEATASPATVTFTNANWAQPQTITVTGVDDAAVDGTQTTTITLSVDAASSDDAFDAASDQTRTATTTDNDVAGFTVTGGPLTVDESGTTATFTVVLSAQPLTNVVFSVASSDVGEATVAPATLTFTNANWNTPQTVTVTGVDDALVDGSQASTATVSVVDASSDNAFDPLADQTVAITTTDNDAAGFTITQSGGSTQVSEAGTVDSFTVVLTTQPTSNVVLTVASGDVGEATAAPAALTFTNANWNTPQTVTVTGVDDALVDGSQVTAVTVSVDDANSDNVYDPVPDQTVNVTTTDDDVAGFTVTGGPLTVSEAGTTGTFTVVLSARPLTNVVFSMASSDVGEATVAPATLTFTNANWNTPQTVTVTGVDDGLVDGSQASTVTVSVVDASSDNAFDPLADQAVAVTTTDNDVAGFTVTGGPLTVSESGTTGTFTVVLGAQPLTNVVFSVASSDVGEATAAPATLTFTNANWNTPQTVTVTGVDDGLVDGSQPSTMTVSVVDASSDDAFDPLADQTVAVTTTDNDAPGFSVTGGPVTVSEAGTTGTFTVVLTTQPLTNVVFSVVSSDVGEATVAPATLTFTNANWNTPQTVTVTGVDDGLVDGSQASTTTVSVVDASSDNAFDALPDQTVAVTTTDNDAAGFTLTGGPLTVSEAGTTGTFTVVLSAQPLTNVVFSVASSDVGEATVAPATLTFTNANWNTPQTVTVTGVDDALVDGSQPSTVTVAVVDASSDDAFDPLANQTVGVTTTDDETAGFTVTGGPLAVSEAGTTGTFTVVLTAQPVGNVVFNVASSDAGEATAAPATLTFTNASWNTPQTVTVTGVDDAAVDGSQPSTVTVSVVDASSDNAFDPLPNQAVAVTTADDDAAGFTVTGGPLTVSEAGTTGTFTVVLGAQPLTNVVFSVASSDVGEATAAPATLTFTNANWNTPQTVTVTGVDDALIDGSQPSTVTVSVVDASSDDAFDPLADQTVAVTTTDNDVAGFTVTGGPLTVSEAGTTGTFTVVLTSQPATNVVFSVASSDVGEATVAPATLTFTNANWNTPQTVTVTGADDALIDGSQPSTVTVSVVDASSDNAFDPLADQTVAVTTTDNDVAGFTVTGGSLTVSEAGTTGTFTVALTAQPVANVVFSVVSSDVGEATVAPATLTFTNANWNTPQTVTVTGVDDALVDGNQASTVTVSVVDASSDNAFDPLADQTVAVTTTDNDAAGFTVTQSGGSTQVSESGTTDAFTLVLTAQPATNVVLTVASGDAGEATADPAALTFTNANWNVAQTVTVTGVDDNVDDGNQVTPITVSVDGANSDNTYDPVPDQTVNVTTVDDDAAGFTLTDLGALSVTEAGSTYRFTVALTSQPITNVVLNVSSGDLTEATVAPATLTFTSADWNAPQTVTVTGVDDALVDGNQQTTITVSVDDANSDDAFDPLANQTRSVTTTDDDVAGFAVTGGPLTVSEAGTTGTFTVVLSAQPLTDVVFSVASSDPGEATAAPATLTFTNANWNVAQTVTVTGVDDALVDGSQASTMTVSVVDASSDDAFDPLADRTVAVTTTDNDAAGFTVTGGPLTVDESGTTGTFTVVLSAQPLTNVVFNVTSSDTGESTASPATLTFTSANWDAPQTVTVTGVNDALVDGSQPSTVSVSVVDASSDNAFDPLADQTVAVTTTDDDVAGFSVTGGPLTVDESGTTGTFTVVLTAQPLTDVVFTVGSSDVGEATAAPATLTFTNANWNVAQTVTVTGVDDAIIDGDQVSTITVAVDDAASNNAFDPLANQTVSVTTTDNDAPAPPLVRAGFSGEDRPVISRVADRGPR